MDERRRLAAILAADMVGYSRLMEADESGTIARQNFHRAELIDPKITEHNGRIVKTTGDGLLVEFASVVDAVKCAVEIQSAIAERESDASDNDRLMYRMGINIGDIVIQDDDIFGDGVNVAARIEGLCQPGEVCLSGAAYDQVSGKLDFSFENLGQRKVKNINKRIQIYRANLDSSAPKSLKPIVTEKVGGKPSIAVLPFQNLSHDPEQEYFSDGITADITTALSRIRQFFVISRNTMLTFKSQAIDVSELATELGVRYVLEGSVRRVGNRIRLSVQLIDGKSGNLLWAERYDSEFEDIFAVQDEITQTVIGKMGPEIVQVEVARAKLKLPDNLSSWDYCHRGLSFLYQDVSPENLIEASRNFEKAIELDDNFALPYAGMVHVMYRQIIHGWGITANTKNEIIRLGQEAVKRDRNDAITHTALSGAYLANRQLDKAIQEGEIACDLNPNYFGAIFWTGTAIVWSGNPSKGIRYLELALKISPRDPWIGQALSRLSEAYISLGDYQIAVELAKRAVVNPNIGIWPHATLVVSLALSDANEEEIAKARTALLDKMPKFTSAHFRENLPATDPHFQHIYIEGLRKAAVPES